MRIVAVGAVLADTIVHAGGSVTESLGGIAHTVAALSAIGGGEHDIFPVFRVGGDLRPAIDRWADELPGVWLDGVVPMVAPTPAVRLTYEEGGERVEQLRHLPAPLDASEVDVAHGADAVIVNCISGNDLTVAALRKLRAGTRRLYLDVHSLVLGFRDDGRRFHRGREDWDDWLDHADVVQCNEAEARTLSGPAGESVAEGAAKERAVEALATRIGALRAPLTWLLTRGSDGAVVLRGGEAGVRVTAVAAPRGRILDPTGAGDTFGAAYTCQWLAGATPEEAAADAVRYASAACAVAGVVTPQGLREAYADLPDEPD